MKIMKIIMIDQDGVIIDREYRLTADISELINQLNHNQDYLIVPNTDTPVARIHYNFQTLLDLNPRVIIAEKGAVVEIENKKIFTKSLRNFESYRLALLKLFRDRCHAVAIGDSATWVREKKRFEPLSRLLIIDGLREQTIGFYLKKTDGKGLVFTDEDWSREGLDLAKSIPLPVGLQELDFNPIYGIAIANVKNCGKKDGFLILSQTFPQAHFFMIGDSDSDYIDDKSVIHCAVSNASNFLKKRSKFVSRYPITEGLKECLEWIITN